MRPGCVRGVVVARGVRNGPSPVELVGLPRHAEAEAQGRLGVGRIAEEPCIAA
jgi:hypothetical protein